MIKTKGATRRIADPLEGEDIKTTHWQDARHWMNIHDELIRFKSGVAERLGLELTHLPPSAQRTATTDLACLEAQISGHQERLKLWTRRAWPLHGMWLDRSERVLRQHDGRTAALTDREFELLRFRWDE